MNEGILLTTGNAAEAKGPNNKLLSDGTKAWQGDQDLEQGLGIRGSYNATILEFDFVAHNSNKINFDYLFASEQYLRNQDNGSCDYTDGFAFLIKEVGSTDSYKNLAIIPGTETPIRSNTVRGGGEKCAAVNENYFGHYNFSSSPINYNGQTQVLTATTEVVPGKKYHLKLVIADQGNELYDSAVFLKAGSFTGNKVLGSDKLISSNNAICPGTTYTINAFTAGSTYQWYKNGTAISGATNSTLDVNSAGTYSVDVNSSGCPLKGSIVVEYYPTFSIPEKTFNYCDNNLSGIVPINLNDISKQLLPNVNSDYSFKYCVDKTDAENNSTNYLNDWSFSSDTSIYVRVQFKNCDPVVQKVNFKLDSKIILNKAQPINICDNELKGSKEINLVDYVSLFSTLNNLDVQYFKTLSDAKSASNPIVDPKINLNTNSTFYYRIKTNTLCPNIEELQFNFKQPKKSTTLLDAIICPGQKVSLDAGLGFDHYRWSNGQQGNNLSSISVPIGDYWVELTSNGCVYKQFVKVSTPETPIINSIQVSGSTITIDVSGGLAPYQYSIDGKNWQNTSTFNNLSRGLHTVYVKGADNCSIVTKEALIINLVNFITPNGDGYNDVLDYSDLRIKKEVSIQVFDRKGLPVYQSNGKDFVWDGKFNGRPVSTDTYWYIIKWVEPDTNLPVFYNDWILIKNR